MKIKLKKDLPDYPAGITFRQDGSIWEIDSTHSTGKALPTCIPDWLHSFVMSNWDYPDWFERIDETPLYWEPELGEKYYYVEGFGYICNGTGKEGVSDSRIEIGNAFPTKEAAQAHVEYLKALTRVRKWIQEQEIRTASEGEHGYEITSNGALSTPNKTNPVLPKIWGDNDANQVIDNCQDDLKTIFGVES